MAKVIVVLFLNICLFSFIYTSRNLFLPTSGDNFIILYHKFFFFNKRIALDRFYNNRSFSLESINLCVNSHSTLYKLCSSAVSRYYHPLKPRIYLLLVGASPRSVLSTRYQLAYWRSGVGKKLNLPRQSCGRSITCLFPVSSSAVIVFVVAAVC